MEKTNLSRKEELEIVSDCKNKIYEMADMLQSAKTIDEVYNIVHDLDDCDWTDDTKINDNISHFTFIFHNIMIDGYVTPYGIILSKKVEYNPFNEDGDIYYVNTETYEVEMN